MIVVELEMGKKVRQLLVKLLLVSDVCNALMTGWSSCSAKQNTEPASHSRWWEKKQNHISRHWEAKPHLWEEVQPHRHRAGILLPTVEGSKTTSSQSWRQSEKQNHISWRGEAGPQLWEEAEPSRASRPLTPDWRGKQNHIISRLTLDRSG